MKLIDKIVRLPLRPEILALLEKIDSIDSQVDTSYEVIKRLLTEEGFGFYERMTLKRTFANIARRNVYARVMHVVIESTPPEEYVRKERARAYAAHEIPGQRGHMTLGGMPVPPAPLDNVLQRKFAATVQKQMKQK